MFAARLRAKGWLLPTAPANAGAQGREAAIVDIAQDLLLRELAHEGILDTLAFKGGTALRKLWAGATGRRTARRTNERNRPVLTPRKPWNCPVNQPRPTADIRC